MTFENYIIENYTVADLCHYRFPYSEPFTHFGLSRICEEAEKSYRNITYINEDGSDASAKLWGENIGTGIGVSLAPGNLLPLIGAAANGIQGQVKIDKETNRELARVVDDHVSRIQNFLFEINSRKVAL